MRKGAKNKDKAAIDKEVAVNRFGWGGVWYFVGGTLALFLPMLR